jgi:hypothetical protein
MNFAVALTEITQRTPFRKYDRIIGVHLVT